MSKVHAMLDLEVMCGLHKVHALRATIVNGRRNDRLAKLITCRTCLRLWKKAVRS